jgi:hypothetical protein
LAVWSRRPNRIETCRDCGGAVRIIACIEDPLVIEKILTHLDSARQCVPEAILALAKYKEHVAHDYQSALAASLELGALQPGEGAHRFRLGRLQRKLSARRAK